MSIALCTKCNETIDEIQVGCKKSWQINMELMGENIAYKSALQELALTNTKWVSSRVFQNQTLMHNM